MNKVITIIIPNWMLWFLIIYCCVDCILGLYVVLLKLKLEKKKAKLKESHDRLKKKIEGMK